MHAMRVTPIKTSLVTPKDDLWEFLRNHLDSVPERSVLVVTSKIISLCEGNVVALEGVDKQQLIVSEAEQYLDPSESEFGVTLTIKNGILAVSSGIDESNGEDIYMLLPKDSFVSAKRIWSFLREEYGVSEVGVVVSDSTTQPLRWGVVGRSLAYCGFIPRKDLRGTKDLVGRELVMTQMNIAEGLASAAVLEMGEGDSSTPLCLVEDITHIVFVDEPPSAQEKSENRIPLSDDVYAPLLKKADWRVGGVSTETS